MKICASRLPVRFCSSSASDSCASVMTAASRSSSPRRLVERDECALEVAMGHPKFGATCVPARLNMQGRDPFLIDLSRPCLRQLSRTLLVVWFPPPLHHHPGWSLVLLSWSLCGG